MTLYKKNIEGKGENGNRNFLLFPQCFLPYQREKIIMSNFTFFHNVFYAISILKSFNSHIIIMSNFTFFHNVFYAISILKSFNSHIIIMSNFTFFHNVFYAISILKSFNSHIPVVVCSFFEFGTVYGCRLYWSLTPL